MTDAEVCGVGTAARLWSRTMSTGRGERDATAPATPPVMKPGAARPREPRTMRLAWCSSAVSMIAFQVGVPWTALACARNPAAWASAAPCVAVCSAACWTSWAHVASNVAPGSGRNPTLYVSPHGEDQRVLVGWQLPGRPVLSRLWPGPNRRRRIRRGRRGRGARGPRAGGGGWSVTRRSARRWPGRILRGPASGPGHARLGRGGPRRAAAGTASPAPGRSSTGPVPG